MKPYTAALREGREEEQVGPHTRERTKVQILPTLPDEHPDGSTVATHAGGNRGKLAGGRAGELAQPFTIAGRRYGATMSTAEVAELFCCSTERLQQERGRGTLPVEPLQLGRRLRWPTVLVAKALGLVIDSSTDDNQGDSQ